MKAREFSELWFYLGVSIWKKCEWIDNRMFLGFNGMDKAGLLFIYLFFLRVLLRFWGKWFKIFFWGFNGIDKAGLFLSFFFPLHVLQRFWGKWFTILKLAFEYARDGVRNFSRLSWDGAWIPFLLPASIRLVVVLVQANAASGMAVSDECKLKFMELKRKKTYRYIIFKIDQVAQQIILERTGGPEATYEDFASHLPEDDCRYGVYDFDFVTDDNCQKSKIFFVAW